jgi:hypothetical protein
VKSARSIVVMKADESNRALTTQMPVMRAVLFQFVFSISGARSFPNYNCKVISALGKVPTLFGTAGKYSENAVLRQEDHVHPANHVNPVRAKARYRRFYRIHKIYRIYKMIPETAP